MDAEAEAEIKIEYCESFDQDPLRAADPLSLSNDFDSMIIRDDGDITDEDDDQVKINDENIVVPENHTNWYSHVDNFGRYICKFCSISYSTTQTLRNHVRMRHTEHFNKLKKNSLSSIRKRKLKCHVCNEKLNTRIDLKKHIEAHGLKNIQKSCPVCHATFEETQGMLDHIMAKHKPLKTLHFCTICGYSTPKLSHFKQHKNTHTLGNEIKCSYCDYSTNYKPNMTIHERIHTNEKPYKCEYDGCEYSCAAKSGLYSHQLKHDREKNKLFCDQCSYTTVYKNSLKKHIESHTRNSVRKRF